MQDFDAKTEEELKGHEEQDENGEDTGEIVRLLFRKIAQKLVLFVSFGPGVIGFIWLLARILRR